MFFISCTICVVLGSMTMTLSATNAIPLDYDFECRGLPENFIFWWACGSYGVCRGGRYVQVDCVNGTSYDRVLGDCRDHSEGVNFPCNRQPSCLEYDGPGMRYPEVARDNIEGLPECTFYYTCSYGRYLGHQRCNQGTVYDQVRQTCLRPNQVPPPCGTYNEDVRTSFQDKDGIVIGQDGRPVVSLPVDNQGNLDRNKWPFTNNRQPSRNNRDRFQPRAPQPFQQTFNGGPRRFRNSQAQQYFP